MHPPFYVPPPMPGHDHPTPLGVKRNIRRARPERLNLGAAPPPGFPLEAHVPPRPAAPLGPPLRVRLGRALIRLGRALAREPDIAAEPERG